MKQPVFLLALAMLFTCSSAGIHSDDSIHVKKVPTEAGYISGTTGQNGTVLIFKGVPYAEPPLAGLRWKPPVPAKHWEGIKKCEQFQASAMQAKPAAYAMWSMEFQPPVEPIGEDCLYLNIWTKAKSTSEKLPVIVWIHGGAFINGSGSVPLYNGEEMAQKGVVFVTINYRLGVFGFLAHPELSAESSEHISGNYGILDQIAALEWVKRNITSFGGDPGNVTIAGQSAGAFSVNALVVSPKAKGLFQRAIAQSGGMFGNRTRGSGLSNAEENGRKFTERLNVNIEQLRAMPASDLLKAGGNFGIVIDHVTIHPAGEAFMNSLQNDVPLLTGWNADEINLDQPKKATDYIRDVKKQFGDDADEFLGYFPGSTDNQAAASQRLYSVLSFGWQNYCWASMQDEKGKNKSYLYYFTHVPPGQPYYGAFHSAEFGYALNTLKYWNRPFEAYDHQLAGIMSSYWVNFAKTGNPNGEGLPEWPSFDMTTKKVMNLGDTIKAIDLPFQKQLEYLDAVNGGLNFKMSAFINDLMKRMTVDEKIGQLNLTTAGDFVTGSTASANVEQKLRNGQIGGLFNSFSVVSMKAAQDIAVNESPNHIPLLFGMDVIHGYKTIFPIPLALSCSWDMDLIEKSARIAAEEATANGVSWTYSPMVDIARDPRWGRIAEGSGEDPWLGSQIAKAMVKGYQGNDLTANNTMMACVKHFALYGAAEGGRDYNTVDMSRITMYNDYLPPYKAAVEAGAGSVMTSFNVVDAVPSTANHWLLTDLLREQWGFQGFVVTDYTAINEMINHGLGDLQEVSAMALKAGADMDMVGEGFLTTLKKSLSEGKISLNDIETACRRVLEAKYKLGLFEDPYRYISEERAKSTVKKEFAQDAYEIALRSMVLLKNDKQVLPLKKTGTIAVIGPLAASKADILGTWAMGGKIDNTSSALDGIKRAAGNGVKIIYAQGAEVTDNPNMLNSPNPLAVSVTVQKKGPQRNADELLKEALDAAVKSDVIVAVLGEPSAWSGEAASLANIALQQSQQRLLKALVSTGKPVVLVLINGRPMTLPWENENVNAILEAWAGGSEGGNAIGDILFGHYNPSGKLTTTFPDNLGQMPIYYNHKNTGRPMQPESKFTSKYLDSPNDPVYPFGFGLSYSTFQYGDLILNKTQLKGDDQLLVTFTITNTGKMAGEEVIQLYIRDQAASISRPVKELKGFKKVMLQSGEKKEITMEVSSEQLKFYNSNLKYDWEPGAFTVFIGTNSRDTKSANFNWVK